jgi:flagellar protein FlgJ
MTLFFNKYGGFAANAAKGSKIFPQTVLSAAALESGYGKSGLAAKYNNFFGFKSSAGWKGKVVNMSTREQSNQGVESKIIAGFRVYPSPVDSFKDYVRLLQTERYVKGGVTSAKTPEEQFKAIQSSGYATDIKYSSKLTSIYQAVKDLKFTATTAVSSIIAVAGLVFLLINQYKK